jgi:alkylation response protein AidB-like acyl-CoA dehydrogenase
MNTQARESTSQIMKFPETGAVLPGLTELIAAELAPKVVDIDVHAQYPKDFMHKLGAIGGFASMTPTEFGGSGRGLKHAIQVIEGSLQGVRLHRLSGLGAVRLAVVSGEQRQYGAEIQNPAAGGNRRIPRRHRPVQLDEVLLRHRRSAPESDQG